MIRAAKADGDPGMLEMWENSIKRLHEVSAKKALEQLKPAGEEGRGPEPATLQATVGADAAGT